MEELPEKWTPLVRGITQGIMRAAQQLRACMTPSEVILWERLRERRLYGLRFRRQHAVGRFILDFYCAQAKLGVEIDGSVHDNRAEFDAERTLYLSTYGYHIIRFDNADIENRLQEVLDIIVSEANDRISAGKRRLNSEVD